MGLVELYFTTVNEKAPVLLSRYFDLPYKGVNQNPDSGSNKLQRALALPPALSALLKVMVSGSDAGELFKHKVTVTDSRV